MGGCKYVDEGLETSGWNFRVDLTHLSNAAMKESRARTSMVVASCGRSRTAISLAALVLEVLELKRSEEVMLGDDVEVDDDQRRQCEEEKNCQRGECPKVHGRWRESVAWCDEVVTGESVCDDEKVSEGDGGEVNDFEEQISWPQHTVVALETVEMVQKEWNGELGGVEDVKELPQLDPVVEEQEEKEIKQHRAGPHSAGKLQSASCPSNCTYVDRLQTRCLERDVEWKAKSLRMVPGYWEHRGSLRGQSSLENSPSGVGDREAKRPGLSSPSPSSSPSLVGGRG
eukprot:s3121_g3.t1